MLPVRQCFPIRYLSIMRVNEHDDGEASRGGEGGEKELAGYGGGLGAKGTQDTVGKVGGELRGGVPLEHMPGLGRIRSHVHKSCEVVRARDGGGL